jgi:alcohol dehydrogenase class IV
MTHPASADWFYPTTVCVGPGRVRELPAQCRAIGLRRPLFVTDSVLSSMPLVQEVLELCSQQDLQCGLFDRIKSNPSGKNIADGLASLKAGGYDGVIAFGGGSALDAGKAIALMAGQKRPLWDFEDIGDNHLRVDPVGIAPVIAVPTTAGTGSEVGRASVITDERARVKRTILHLRMLPRVAILDPELTLGLPQHLTAATGADALTHCVEAFCSPVYHPMAAAIAIEGIRLVKVYLPQATEHGQDLEARQQMLVASSMGAAAFQRGLGGVHAIAQSLGALYDLHHGLLNAVLLPYVLKANETVLAEPMAMLARHLELPRPGFASVMDWLLTLRERIGIPHTLAALGLDERDADLVGNMSFQDGCSHTNPIRHSAARYTEIFRAAVRGT